MPKTQRPYKGKSLGIKSWYKEIGVKSLVKLKTAPLQGPAQLIVLYHQLILAKPVRKPQVHYKGKISITKSWPLEVRSELTKNNHRFNERPEATPYRANCPSIPGRLDV